MKTLYLECNMGATDTMLLSALYDACEHKTDFIKIMNEALAPFSIIVSASFISKRGICGTRLAVQLPELTPPAPLAKTPAVQAKNETEEHLNYLLAHAMLQHEQEQKLSENTKTEKDAVDSLDQLVLPAPVKEDVAAIYKLIATATKELCQPAVWFPQKIQYHICIFQCPAGCPRKSPVHVPYTAPQSLRQIFLSYICLAQVKSQFIKRLRHTVLLYSS